MKSVIFSIFLYLILILPAAQRKICNTCRAVNYTTCKNEDDECPDSDCMTMSKESENLAQKKMCFTCLAVNSETCKDEEEECPDSDCMTMSEELNIFGQVSRSIHKRCAQNLPCNQFFYIYFGQDIYLKRFLQCCKGNMCNTGYFEMPDFDRPAKGILCPSCVAFNTLDGCNATKSLICFGKDDLCVSYRATIKPPGGKIVNISAQGCGAKLACSIDHRTLTGLQVINQLEKRCYIPTSLQSHEKYPQN